ncbi:sodium channel and clathrin linker 1, partial [Lasius niger]
MDIYLEREKEENHFNLQECHVIKELEEELELCKADQNDIRSKLETLYDESNNAMRNFSLQLEGCCNKVCYDKDVQNEVMQNEEITNLKEQIAHLEAVKKSGDLLWQIWNNDTLRIDQLERDNMKLCKEKLEYEQSHLEEIRAYE